MGLDGVIAHGMLSMGFLGQYAASLAGPERSAASEGALRGDGAAGRRAHVQGRRPRGRREAATIDIWAENEEGEKVTTGEAEVEIG